MGSLAEEVELRLPHECELSTYAVSKMADGHGWEAKLIREVPILECVIERL